MVCNASNPNSRCAQGCKPSIAKRDVSMRSGSKAYVMTQGPIIFADDDQELLGEKATSDGMKCFLKAFWHVFTKESWPKS